MKHTLWAVLIGVLILVQALDLISIYRARPLNSFYFELAIWAGLDIMLTAAFLVSRNKREETDIEKADAHVLGQFLDKK